MRYFLAKSEPSVYSIDDLKRDGKTVWDGIKNAQALQAVKSMMPGDRVFFYHSGGESQIVGLAEVKTQARVDPKDPKSWVVDLGYVMHLDPPTTLGEVKGSHEFDGWALVRQSRLSTMEAPEEFARWMRGRYKIASI